MTATDDWREELGLLAAALCDGDITPAQAVRLEELAAGLPEARRFLLDYVHLHGELYWDTAAGAHQRTTTAAAAPAEVPSPVPQAGPIRRRTVAGWATTAAAAAVLAVAASWAFLAFWGGESGPGVPATQAVARLSGTFQAEWAGAAPAPAQGDELADGTVLDLRRGVAEIAFAAGGTAVLEGPAKLRLAADGGFLESGNLVADVRGRTDGFTVHTPTATIVDRGTEFGVQVTPAGDSEIHVFAGGVLVRRTGDVDGAGWSGLGPGEVMWAERGVPELVKYREEPHHEFVRTLPTSGTVAALRWQAAHHPALMHQYTFEGDSPARRLLDSRSSLDLTEVVMAGGRGGGELAGVPGPDPTSTAVRTYRDPRQGNAAGVAMQTADPFIPPRAFTVELLLRFDGFSGPREGAVAAALATRASRRDCGFLAVAVDRGQLTYLMDGDAPWGESDVALVPGEWCYLAMTYRSEDGKTRVHGYAANLTRGERELSRVVVDEVVEGVPAASRLGIGKGFDESLAHAYPWPGAVDEVAIYDAVLDAATLREHFESLTGPE